MCYKKTQTKFLSGNTKKGNPDRRYIFLNISPERQNQKTTKRVTKTYFPRAKQKATSQIQKFLEMTTLCVTSGLNKNKNAVKP